MSESSEHQSAPGAEAPNIGRLVEIMQRLRAPDGCPWDRAQTHQTLKPYLIEEAYEVLEAIEELDERGPRALCEELGDLLLQIVFHAQLASERGDFGLTEVVAGISDKMVRRHPHVFGDETAESISDVNERWAEIKREEGRHALDGVPANLPALLRAQRIGEKAARIGFDWSDVEGVMAKVREELGELEQAMAEARSRQSMATQRRVASELGDLLFATSSLARHLDVVAEEALTSATRRFERRFRAVEAMAADDDLNLEDLDERQLDALWERAKAHLSATARPAGALTERGAE